MTAIALKMQSDDPNARLRADVVVVLERMGDRRMAINTLQIAMRGQGWGGWSSRGWGALCLQLGLYVYKGRTERGVDVTWVGLDQPGEVPADEFVTSGFVVIDHQGRYYRRDQEHGHQTLFTALRSRANVWVSFAWAARRIRQLGGPAHFEVVSTRHMR